MSITPLNLQTRRGRASHRPAGLPIHVLLVDDHPAVRVGMRRLIAAQPDLDVIAEAASASETVGQLARWVDVAVFDYHLGPGEDGLWLTRRIKQLPNPPRILIYSAFADGALAIAAIVAGADGLLSKATVDEELCATIRGLARGRQHLPAVPAALASALSARCKARDQPIFSMLLHGIPPREIAKRLMIPPEELEARRAVILEALAPNVNHARVAKGDHAPLDYDRAQRRLRYPH
jgi:DNA-binding NarL/FixJ family response regulator